MLKVPTNQIVKLKPLDIAHNNNNNKKQTSRHLERWHYVLNCTTSQMNISKASDSKFDAIWRWSLEGGVKLKPGHKCGVLIQWDWCPYKKKRCQSTITHSLSAHRGKAQWRHSEKLAVCKPGREVSLETNPGNLNLQPPEMWDNKCLLFKRPGL